MSHRLDALQTPCLVVDRDRMRANADRLVRIGRDGAVRLRPHLKTVKSVEAALFAMGRPGPATVSTLAEAEQFGRAGFNDLLYAIGIAPDKLDRVLALRREGIDLKVIVDSVEAAECVAARAAAAGDPIPVMIEIDVDGHRAGVQPERGEELVAIARALAGGADLHGVMTHAGESYLATDAETRAAAARAEAERTVAAAATIRAAGHACPVVSVGSTPTAFAPVERLGVTELRAGVYMFFDLVQAGIGVCALDDIALGVLTTVIGHQRDRGWVIVDAGWMALSRDRGTAEQDRDQYYGLVCDEAGVPFEDVVVLKASQEQGTIAARPGTGAALPDWPIGTRLRILPNHACATAAQHDRYHVLDRQGAVAAVWPRFGGW